MRDTFLESGKSERQLVEALRRSTLAEPPAAIGSVRHRPDPQERPDRVQREQADPAGDMDRILVRMVAVLGDLVGDGVNRDDRIEQRDHDEKQQSEREVI